MKRISKLLLVSVAMLMLVLFTCAFTVSPTKNNNWVQSQAVTVRITESGATGFKYLWSPILDTRKVIATTVVRSRSASLDAPGDRECYLHIMPVSISVRGVTTPAGTQKDNGYYLVDKVNPELASGSVSYGDYGLHKASATVGLFIGQTPSHQIFDRNIHVLVHPQARGRQLTVTSPGTYYYNIKTIDRSGRSTTRSIGPCTINSGGALTGTVNGGGDYGGSGIDKIEVWWSKSAAAGGGGSVTPAPPPPAPPTISANPASRGWSQDSLSVYITFGNATSSNASWNPGPGSITSSGTLSKALESGYGGTWYINASASGPGGNVSKTFGPYRIDRKLPTIDFVPNKGGFIDSGSVGIRFKDEHSGLKRVRYIVSNSSSAHNAWSWVGSSGNADNRNVTLPGYGTWYLHAEVEDNVGLKSSRVGGPYVVMNELDAPSYRRWVFIEE